MKHAVRLGSRGAARAGLDSLARAGLLALAGLGCWPATAQVLIQPVAVELAARQRTAVISVALSEKAVAPVRLQAELLRWNQDAQGRALVERSDDLLVSPAIAELRPGQRQLFRVALRNPQPSSQEAAYRLILEDVAEAPTDASGKPQPGIHIRMRYDLPVMVAPGGKVVQALQWKPCAPAASPGSPVAEACVRLHNAGNRRVKLQGVRLAGEGWQQDSALREPAVILAGAQRELRVTLQPPRAGAPRELHVQTSQGDRLQAEPSAAF